MIGLLTSKKGEGHLKGIIVLLIVAMLIFVLVQWARTKIKIASMESTVKEETIGAKIRDSWDEIIIENLLREAESNGIITVDDISNDTWNEKFQIEIYRPLHDRIEITITFNITTNYIVTTKVKPVRLTHKAKIYDL
jgi:hypothetical protein